LRPKIVLDDSSVAGMDLSVNNWGYTWIDVPSNANGTVVSLLSSIPGVVYDVLLTSDSTSLNTVQSRFLQGRSESIKEFRDFNNNYITPSSEYIHPINDEDGDGVIEVLDSYSPIELTEYSGNEDVIDIRDVVGGNSLQELDVVNGEVEVGDVVLDVSTITSGATVEVGVIFLNGDMSYFVWTLSDQMYLYAGNRDLVGEIQEEFTYGGEDYIYVRNAQFNDVIVYTSVEVIVTGLSSTGLLGGFANFYLPDDYHRVPIVIEVNNGEPTGLVYIDENEDFDLTNDGAITYNETFSMFNANMLFKIRMSEYDVLYAGIDHINPIYIGGMGSQFGLIEHPTRVLISSDGEGGFAYPLYIDVDSDYDFTDEMSVSKGGKIAERYSYDYEFSLVAGEIVGNEISIGIEGFLDAGFDNYWIISDSDYGLFVYTDDNSLLYTDLNRDGDFKDSLEGPFFPGTFVPIGNEVYLFKQTLVYEDLELMRASDIEIPITLDPRFWRMGVRVKDIPEVGPQVEVSDGETLPTEGIESGVIRLDNLMSVPPFRANALPVQLNVWEDGDSFFSEFISPLEFTESIGIDGFREGHEYTVSVSPFLPPNIFEHNFEERAIVDVPLYRDAVDHNSILTAYDMNSLGNSFVAGSNGVSETSQYLSLYGRNSFEENTDTDIVDLYMRYNLNDLIFSYEMIFEPDFYSYIEGNNRLVDLENELLYILGHEYEIVDATLLNDEVHLRMMRGGVQKIIGEGEIVSLSYDGVDYEVEGVQITDDIVQLRINGELTREMVKSEVEVLSSGEYVGIADIINDESGDDLAVFFLPVHWIMLSDSDITDGNVDYGSNVVADGHTIGNAGVQIDASQESGDLRFDRLFLTLKSNADLWMGSGEYLTDLDGINSESVTLLNALDIDLTQMVVDGSRPIDVDIESSGDDTYNLFFENIYGNSIKLPIAYDPTVNGGIPLPYLSDSNNRLVLHPDMTGINKNEYFIITDDSNEFTDVLQYKGADKVWDENGIFQEGAVMKFRTLGSGESIEKLITPIDGNAFAFVEVGGVEITFTNMSIGDSSASHDDFVIKIAGSNRPIEHARIRTENGGIIGLLSEYTNSGDATGDDPFILDKILFLVDEERYTSPSSGDDWVVLQFSASTTDDLVDFEIIEGPVMYTVDYDTNLKLGLTEYGSLVEKYSESSKPSTLDYKVPGRQIMVGLTLEAGEITASGGSVRAYFYPVYGDSVNTFASVEHTLKPFSADLVLHNSTVAIPSLARYNLSVSTTGTGGDYECLVYIKDSVGINRDVSRIEGTLANEGTQVTANSVLLNRVNDLGEYKAVAECSIGHSGTLEIGDASPETNSAADIEEFTIVEPVTGGVLMLSMGAEIYENDTSISYELNGTSYIPLTGALRVQVDQTEVYSGSQTTPFHLSRSLTSVGEGEHTLTATYTYTYQGRESVITTSDSFRVVGSDDLLDYDGDGIINRDDDDDDNDGVPDTSDRLIGENDDIEGNLNNPRVFIGNTNVTLQDSFGVSANSEKFLEIRDGSKTIVKAKFDFSQDILLLQDLRVEIQPDSSGRGYVLVRGLGEINKTLYVDNKSKSISSVCVRDEEVGAITDISNGCRESNEHFVSCDGVAHSGYVCAYDNNTDRYEVTGLHHSAVIEQAYVAPPAENNNNNNNNNRGRNYIPYTGGGLCRPDWNCTAWSACTSGKQNRQCVNENNCYLSIACYVITFLDTITRKTI